MICKSMPGAVCINIHFFGPDNDQAQLAWRTPLHGKPLRDPLLPESGREVEDRQAMSLDKRRELWKRESSCDALRGEYKGTAAVPDRENFLDGCIETDGSKLQYAIR